MASAAARALALLFCGLLVALGSRVLDSDSLGEGDLEEAEEAELAKVYAMHAEAWGKALRLRHGNATSLVEAQSVDTSKGWPGMYVRIWDSRSCSRPGAPSSTFCTIVKQFPEQVKGCGATSPWQNVLKMHGEGEKSEKKIANDVIWHLENPAGTVRQSTQGLCGTAAHVFLMALAMPGKYAEMVLNIFCTGKYGPSISSENTIANSVRSLLRQDESLITKKALVNGDIGAVDWMPMTTLRNSLMSHQLGIGTAASDGYQGTTVDDMAEYDRLLYNLESSTLVLSYLGKPNRPFSPLFSTLWNPIVQDVGSDAVLYLLGVFVGLEQARAEFVARETRGRSNHIVVLLTSVETAEAGKYCFLFSNAKILKSPCDELGDFVVRARKYDLAEMATHLPQGIIDFDRVKQMKAEIAKKPLDKFDDFAAPDPDVVKASKLA